MQQLNAQDGAQDGQFYYMQQGDIVTHVMAVNVYDPSTAPGGKVEFQDFRVPLDLDFPYWVEDEHFDIMHHLMLSHLPEPGGWRQFCDHLTQHFNRPMDMKRPLWDMLVIEGLGGIDGFPDGAYAIAIRLHHAAIDGASAMHFLSDISDRDAEGTPANDRAASGFELGEAPSAIAVMNQAFVRTVQSPVKMAGALARFAPALWDSIKSTVNGNGGPRTKVPDTRFNQPITPHRVFDAVIVQLEDMKRIKGHVDGATINDAVLAVCSGTLRRYLDYHGELPGDPLVALSPVNARSGESDSETPGNVFSAMSIALPTNVANPLDRLRVTRDTTLQTKAAKSGLAARVTMDVSKEMPAAMMAMMAQMLGGGRFSQKMCNLTVSNVPGPAEPLYMNGAKMLHNYAVAPLTDGMGLFIAVGSYNGEMSFNVVSSPEIMPDIEFFKACLEDSFEELLADA
jgi:WS/DGAT/MGAT family acyltransferase